MSGPKPTWIRIPIAQLTAPQQGGLHMVYKDRWWAIDAKGNALVYKTTASPRCNLHKTIVERLMLDKHGASGAVEVRFIPWAIVPVDIKDYE